jgi:hypothetical protein
MSVAIGKQLPQTAKPARVMSSNGTVAHDVPFAILFGLVVAGIAAAAIFLPTPRMDTSTTYAYAATDEAEMDADMAALAVPSIVAAVGAIAGTTVFCTLWLLFMKLFAKLLIMAALVVPVVFYGGVTLCIASVLFVNEFATHEVFAVGCIGLLLTLGNAYWLKFLWHKIPATSLALSLSSHIIFQLPLTMVVAATVVVLQVAWIILTSVATGKIYSVPLPATPEDPLVPDADPAQRSLWPLVGLLVALCWGLMVLANVGYVTTCGSIASWYFERESAERGFGCCKPVVFESLGRALTTSFGSICVGSLLVAIVQTVCALLKWIEVQAREDGNVVFVLVACCFRCVMSCVESLLEMFNEWAFIYVSIYSTDFATAGRAVYRLVSEEGISTILTGLVADQAIGYGVLFATLAGTGSGYAAAYFVNAAAHTGNEASVTFVFAVLVVSGLVSFCLASTCLSPVRAGLRTILICFAEAPGALHAVEPELHDAFKELRQKGEEPADGDRPTAVGVPVANASRADGYDRLVAP